MTENERLARVAADGWYCDDLEVYDYEVMVKIIADTYSAAMAELERLRRQVELEHDTTPLTLELAKEVLGEPDESGVWMIHGASLVWSSKHHCIVSSSGLSAHHIGQLRRLVSVLRCEV